MKAVVTLTLIVAVVMLAVIGTLVIFGVLSAADGWRYALGTMAALLLLGGADRLAHRARRAAGLT